jgi:hypothetical protein
LTIRWNGEITETTLDVFSRQADFEGYRVYYGEDNRSTDYVLLSSYDLRDYNMYVWDPILLRWQISDTPFLLDSLKAFFGADFDPEQYDSENNYFDADTNLYYFRKQDWNISDPFDESGIHKVYPNADLNNPGDTTEEGYHRFYEYEYVIEGLLPSIPYYVTVTAFDYGSRKIALSSLESAYNVNAVKAYALPGDEMVEKRGLNVSVYPNPYRIDGNYAGRGYENRDRNKSSERARAVNFINLPSNCTIRIFTIDGDLVKEIIHDQPSGSPRAQIETWNLITRNTQAVVTGLYIWQVESEMGDQIGKLVIMK